MAIITISRGSYDIGKEVAENVAARLGYDCIGREVLIKASEQFDIPEIKYARAFIDTPTVLEKLTFGKERYIAYFEAAFLRHMLKGDVVYHGLAGNFFLKGVAHVMKVRIIADVAERVRMEIGRKGLSAVDAVMAIQRDDEASRQWSRALYGIDTWDPSLYDVVLQIKKISVKDAVKAICIMAGFDTFKTTAESQKVLEDLALAAEVRVAIIPLKLDINVYARDGDVHIETKSSLTRQDELIGKMEETTMQIPGVKKVDIKVSPVNWSD